MKALDFIHPWTLPFPSYTALGKWFIFPQFYFLMRKMGVTMDTFRTVVMITGGNVHRETNMTLEQSK